MSRLTSGQRRDFAGPHKSFPIPDKNHARAALSDVGRAKGLSSSEKAHIKAVAHEKLRSGER